MMTNQEAVAAASEGLRVETGTTSVGPFTDDPARCVHGWRVVACDNEWDVIECWKCGLQKIAACNFDDDMA